MIRTRIASLVPGRVAGVIETDPARSASGKLLLLRQEQLAAVTAPPAGVVLVEAAPFSHALIGWLGRGPPMGLIDAAHAGAWAPGERAVLDSAAGELRAAMPGAQVEPWHAPPPPATGTPVRTADGIEVWLNASVSGTAGVRRAIACGATGIGLVRSELLLPDAGAQPDAAFYRHALEMLLSQAGSLAVTIRLLDLAPDKWPDWLNGTGEAVVARHKLHGSQLYELPAVHGAMAAQLLALAAIAGARLRLLWPSGAGIEDFACWRDEARRILPAGVAVGAMVESPLELLALPRWLQRADFVSIGCNDLLAHLSAADRDDPAQRLLLDPYRPELFRFLGDAARRAGADLARVQLCGLLSQVDGLLPVLVGLGYRRCSVEPMLIPLLAQRLTGITLANCCSLAAAVCACESASAVRRLLGVPGDVPWGMVRDQGGAEHPGAPE